MNGYLFLIGAIVLIAGLFIWFLRKFSSPEMTAQTLLKKYDVFERYGIPESERLFQLLATRGGWKTLPNAFLQDLTSRLDTKEDVIKFVVVSERYRIDRTHFPSLAAKGEPELAMQNVAVLLASLGNKLERQGQLGEARLVQLLALRIGQWRDWGGS